MITTIANPVIYYSHRLDAMILEKLLTEKGFDYERHLDSEGVFDYDHQLVAEQNPDEGYFEVYQSFKPQELVEFLDFVNECINGEKLVG